MSAPAVDDRERSKSYLSPKVKLVRTEDRGRILVATEPLHEGEVVISEEPYAFVVAKAYREYVCAYCCQFCSSEKAFVISSSDNTKYCSERCITLDYLIHSLEIDALGNVDRIQGSDACRLVIKLAATRKYENLKGVIRNKKEILQTNPTLGRENIFSEVKTLQPERRFIPQETQDIIQETASALAQIASNHKLPLNSSDAEHFIYAIHSNAHQLIDINDSLLGVGLFPFTSMMNHSCRPNCSHSFLFGNSDSDSNSSGSSSSSDSSSSSSSSSSKSIPRLVMRTLTGISTGEELCYSYVRLYQTTEARRKVLSSVYSFICSCQRCDQGGFEDDDVDVDGGDKMSATGGEGEKKHPISIAFDSVIGLEDLSDLDDLIPDKVEDKEDVIGKTTDLLEELRSKAESLSNGEGKEFGSIIPLLFESDARVDRSRTFIHIHPCHIVLFKVYVALFRNVCNCIRKGLLSTALSEPYKQLVRCISMGLLTLGSIHKFTSTRQLEVGRIEKELHLLVEEALKLKLSTFVGVSESLTASGDFSSSIKDLLTCILGDSESEVGNHAPWLSGFRFREDARVGRLIALAVKSLDCKDLAASSLSIEKSSNVKCNSSDNSRNSSGGGGEDAGGGDRDLAVLTWLSAVLKHSFQRTFQRLESL